MVETLKMAYKAHNEVKHTKQKMKLQVIMKAKDEKGRNKNRVHDSSMTKKRIKKVRIVIKQLTKCPGSFENMIFVGIYYVINKNNE